MVPPGLEETVQRIRKGLATYETVSVWHLSLREQEAAHALRQLLDHILATRHLVIEDDCWFTCPAATLERDGGVTSNEDAKPGVCKCGRDLRVREQVELLATGLRLLIDV